MSRAAAVFSRLADGDRHDRDGLAAATGLEPRELDDVLAALAATGLPIERSARDVALGPGVDWLVAGDIRGALDPAVAVAADIDVLAAAGSSNDVLLAQAPPRPGAMPVCLVEFQHGGRGRRGRAWSAPPGGTLCLSAAWAYAGTPYPLSTLSLVVAVAALRALAVTAGVDAGVKWPNDLVLDERKLGGILVEVRNDTNGTHVVAGIGLNVRVPPPALAALSDWPRGAADLAGTGMRVPSRSVLAAGLVNELWRAFRDFGEAGFEPFAAEWHAAHVLTDRPAVLSEGGAPVDGIVRGIDSDGALLFEQAGQVRRVLAGDVSLRSPA